MQKSEVGDGYLSLWEYGASLWRRSLLQEARSDEESAKTRVYNTLFRVPYHLERFVWVGVISCLNTLLTLLTLLPFRTALHFTRGPLKSGVLFDGICCVALWMGVYIHVAFIEPGMLYFGMKDVTAEFLKITLVYVALDVADKIMCNVGVDGMRMLIESCELYCTGRRGIVGLFLDSLVFMVMTWSHSLVVMSMAMVWYVSMESEKAILTFMIISNFGEIKTTVFKRFDVKKLFILCRMDVVERMNLLIAALFIIVEDLGQVGQWMINRDILLSCAMILILESIVDITKHSVVVNFNFVRPGIYREFLRDVFKAHVELQEEGTVKKLVFEPIGPAILLLRVILAAFAIGTKPPRLKLLHSAFFFLFLCTVKILMGWCLQLCALWYLRYFEMYSEEQQTAFKNSKQA